mgnify:CR=1 FL=1
MKPSRVPLGDHVVSNKRGICAHESVGGSVTHLEVDSLLLLARKVSCECYL